jgi:hypothetical protein
MGDSRLGPLVLTKDKRRVGMWVKVRVVRIAGSRPPGDRRLSQPASRRPAAVRTRRWN